MPRARITHELKTWPKFFEATMRGQKRFEMRRKDRDFQVGDHLLLKEWNPIIADVHFSHTSDADEAKQKAYTGREVLVRVDYILDPDELVQTGLMTARNFVVMSISLLP